MMFRVSLLKMIGLVVVTGCGGPDVAPVSGVVTFEGDPVEGATVTFQPIAQGNELNSGISSYGKTDAQGRYSLKRIDTDATGALVGTHRVSISIALQDESDDSGQTMSDKLPPWYNFNSVLTFDVPAGGTDSADFKLSKTRPKDWKKN